MKQSKQTIAYKWTVSLLALGLWSGTAMAGDLTGKLTSADGGPLPNVWVGALGSVEEEGRGRAVVHETRTTGAGSFEFRDLPDGVYKICAAKPHANLLNPCEWGSTRYEVTVSSVQRTPNIEIPVRFGRVLRVTVDDPGKALELNASRQRPDSLVVLSVLDGHGNEQEMRLDYAGSKSRDYLLVVPVDEALEVVVNSFDADVQLKQGEAKTPLTKGHHKLSVQLSSEEKVDRILRIEVNRAVAE